jgi:phosphatidylinositol alpha-1,6-mannosyltransferase
MRVLQITRNYPPLRGGMERLNARMFEALRGQDETCALLGPSGSTRFVPAGTRVSELPAKPLPATILASVVRGIAMAREIRPDAVLAGSGLAAPAAVMAARSCGARSAVYLHGLDIIAPSRSYQAAWLPCIRRCHRVIVNSANTRRLAIEAGVDAERIAIVHPGTDLPPVDPDARARFRERHGIDAAASILLSVGRMTARKGLAEFVANALPAIVARHPHAQLLVVGDDAPDALHRGAGAGFERVRTVAEASGVTGALRWLGPCSEDELSDAYEGSDVHVFPVRDMPGDVEGFGMVAIESAAHGLPTVAFDVGGVADAVVDGRNGRLVRADDYDAFARAVIELLGNDALEAAKDARDFARAFSWERFGNEVAAALEAAR